MIRGLRYATPLALAGLALAALTGPVATAQGPEEVREDRGRTNIRLTFRLMPLDGGATPVKAYALVVVDGGRSATLLSGSRVPIPRTTLDTGEEPGGRTAPRTEFVYQNVGFSSTAEARILPDGRIRLVAAIEDSRIADGASGPPRVETRQLSIDAILADGVPLEVTRVEGLAERAGRVEIEARVLR